MKAHVTEFAHRSISTLEFKQFLFEYFEDKVEILNTVDWESWFHKPGMPPIDNVFDQTLTNNTLILAEKWKEVDNNNEKTPSIDYLYMDFNTNQKVLFLEKLCSMPPFQINTLEQMDKVYNFSANYNSEIKCKWLILCLLANHSEMYSSAVKFVTSVGRMKFTRTVYRALFAAKGGKEIAVKAFLDHRSFYHPICASMVAKDLHLTEQAQ